MKVYWLEQIASDMPAENSWLSAQEQQVLNTMRFVKRRDDWRLGRWTAKQALAACWHLPIDPANLSSIEIRPAASGAPEAFFRNHRAPVVISLSHRAGRAVCTVAPSRWALLGCDLETVEPHCDAFITDYFTPEEQALAARAEPADRQRLVTLIWSAKESAMKALESGLRVDTRSLIVNTGMENPGALSGARDSSNGEDRGQEVAEGAGNMRGSGAVPSGWHPLRVRHAGSQTFCGCWQFTDQWVRTMVSAPPPAPPLLLNAPARPKFEEAHPAPQREALLECGREAAAFLSGVMPTR